MNASGLLKNRERLSFTAAPPPGPLPNCCEYAEAFLAVCEPMIEKVRQAPSDISANVALLQLQNQYWVRYETAPKAHRHHIGSRMGHTCLFQVYRYLFFQLRDLLLAVNPPPLVREVPAAPPQFEIAGVPYGIRK